MSESSIREMLRGLPVFPAELPRFDTAAAPEAPVPLFLSWLSAAARDKLLGPQAMTLSTADAGGEVTSRVLICKDVDGGGRWFFASDADSGKGRDLAVNAHAAALFYWPQHGRQIRVTGVTAAAGAEASAADFLARPPDSRAAALAGHQSKPLDSPAQLEGAFDDARARVEADPGLVAPGWTLYALTAETVEFWQADQQRRHIRLRYQRAADDGWSTQLLWP
jgi:pyridoxamine 5'-phosphate oxidase